RNAGLEHWFWDDFELSEGTPLLIPGGSVILAGRKITIHLDQSSLVGTQDIPGIHWVKFHGTDVFGTTLETKLLLQTFPTGTRPRPIVLSPVGPVIINPLGDPTRDRPTFDPTQFASALTTMLDPQIGAVPAASLAQSIAGAIATGSATIDR